jgi:uncharacterized OsmC-like protein
LTIQQPIVTKLTEEHVLLSMLDSLPTKPERSDSGEWHFAFQVRAEQIDAKHARRVLVGTDFDGYGNFELKSDEGTSLGGEDSAPAPLAYLCAGVALCLLSHVSVYAKANKMTIDEARVEEFVRFATTAMPSTYREGNAIGGCLGLEIELQIDSPEPDERIAELERVVRESCIALQTIINPVDTRVALKRI